MVSDETLQWFQSSENARRGFCGRCGSNLFWSDERSAELYVTAGTLDKPTNIKVVKHIFVASKSDFYDITDGLPQEDEW